MLDFVHTLAGCVTGICYYGVLLGCVTSCKKGSMLVGIHLHEVGYGYNETRHFVHALLLFPLQPQLIRSRVLLTSLCEKSQGNRGRI